MSDKLNWKEKTEIAIESGLQLVPYIGSSLSTMYFSTKNEKRFKRIESFYQEFSLMINDSEIRLPSIEEHDEEHLAALIENINEKVEKQQIQQKKEYLKRFLLSTLLNPVQEDKDFDERNFFLEVLSNITILECHILIHLHKNSSQTFKDTDLYMLEKNKNLLISAIGRLKSYAFIETRGMTINIGGSFYDQIITESIHLSDFGKKFIDYCLT